MSLTNDTITEQSIVGKDLKAEEQMIQEIFMKERVIGSRDEILNVLRNDYSISKVSFKCWLEDLRYQ